MPPKLVRKTTLISKTKTKSKRPLTKKKENKKIKRPAEPASRDYVRVCGCGSRLLIRQDNHGYLKSLTVELNGYIADITGQCPSEAADKINKLGLPFDWESHRTLLQKGIIKKLPRLDVKALIRRGKPVPKLLVKTFKPKLLKFVYCEHCHTRLYLSLFKEVKHE